MTRPVSALLPEVDAMLADLDARQAAHRDAAFARADHLSASRPTDRVLDDVGRFAQWSDRLAWAESLAGRRGPEHPDVRAAVAEADRYSGRPQASTARPAPMPSPVRITLSHARSPDELLSAMAALLEGERMTERTTDRWCDSVSGAQTAGMV